MKQKLLTNNKDGIKVMTIMLLSSLSQFSVAPRRALRTPMWFVMLAALVFVGEAWGQEQREMKTIVSDSNAGVPTDSRMAFGGMPQSFLDQIGGLTFPNANDASLDPDANGFLNPDTAEIVDWVLVQARVVAGESPPPNAPQYCASNPCVTRPALLMATGVILGVDDSGALMDGVMVFEDLEYDPSSEDLYIAVQHRNHVAILSSAAAAARELQDDDVYGFDFTNPGDIFEGANSVTTNLPNRADGTSRPTGQVAMRAGDAVASDLVNITDLSAVSTRFGRSAPYSLLDANMNGLVEIGDLNAVSAQFGRGASFTFF